MMLQFARLLVAAILLSTQPASAEPLATAAPASVGFSADRLQRLTDTLRAEIGKGTIPGVVLLISRNGKAAYFEALGALDPEQKTPMSKDAIFRIYSMSKPITTTVAMMLVEQGRLALIDPVAKYLPEFKDVKVGEEKPDKTLELVAARRPMTIQDLMRHTSGLTYGFFGEGAVKKAYLAANLNEGDPSTAEFVARLAKLPLVYQPGTTWDYSQATDVLGRVVEVVVGKPLSVAFREMLFDPLGMTDTSFYVTDSTKHPRIAEPFANDRSIGAGAELNDPRVARNYESGGGGLHVHGQGLCALRRDAGQRRRGRRQTLSEPQDGGLHDLRPHGRYHQARPLRPGWARLQVRPWICGAQRRRRVAFGRLAGRFYLGWRRGDLFLGRSQGEDVRDLYDAVAQQTGAFPHHAARYGLCGHDGIAATASLGRAAARTFLRLATASARAYMVFRAASKSPVGTP